MYQNVYITLQDDLTRYLAKTMNHVKENSQFYIIKTSDSSYCKAVSNELELLKEKNIQVIEESSLNLKSKDFEIDLKRFISQIPAIDKKNLFIIAKSQNMYNFCSKNLTFLKANSKKFSANKTYLSELKLSDENQMTFDIENDLFMTLNKGNNNNKSAKKKEDASNKKENTVEKKENIQEKKEDNIDESVEKTDENQNNNGYEVNTTISTNNQSNEISDDEKNSEFIKKIFKTEDIHTAKQLLTSLLKTRLYNNINKCYTSQILSEDTLFQFLIELLKSDNYKSFISSWKSQARETPDEFDEFMYNNLLLQALHYDEIIYLLWDKDADKWDPYLKDDSPLSKIL